MDRRGLLFALLAAALFGAYLWWSNPFQAFAEIGRFDAATYAAAIAVDFLGLFFFVASWWLIVRALGVDLSLLEGVQMTFTSLFVGWVAPIPMNTELVRAILLKDKAGSNTGKAISSVLVHRAFYNIAFGAILSLTALGAALSGRQIPIQGEVVSLLVAFAVVSGLFFSLVLNPAALERVYDGSPGWVRRNVFDRLYQAKGEGGFRVVIAEVEGSVRAIRSRVGLTFLAFACVALHWGLGAVTAWVVARSMGVHLEPWVTVFIYASIEFVQQLNWVVPSGLGVVDAGLTGALILAGVPLSLAAAVSLLIRFATNWVELLLYAPVAFHYGYRGIAEKLKQNGQPT